MTTGPTTDGWIFQNHTLLHSKQGTRLPPITSHLMSWSTGIDLHHVGWTATLQIPVWYQQIMGVETISWVVQMDGNPWRILSSLSHYLHPQPQCRSTVAGLSIITRHQQGQVQRRFRWELAHKASRLFAMGRLLCQGQV